MYKNEKVNRLFGFILRILCYTIYNEEIVCAVRKRQVHSTKRMVRKYGHWRVNLEKQTTPLATTSHTIYLGFECNPTGGLRWRSFCATVWPFYCSAYFSVAYEPCYYLDQ